MFIFTTLSSFLLNADKLRFTSYRSIFCVLDLLYLVRRKSLALRRLCEWTSLFSFVWDESEILWCQVVLKLKHNFRVVATILCCWTVFKFHALSRSILVQLLHFSMIRSALFWRVCSLSISSLCAHLRMYAP